MKRWTRKLLAGLLSVGMLLQVASPLSALAAEDVGSDASGVTTANDKVTNYGITVTMNNDEAIEVTRIFSVMTTPMASSPISRIPTP